MNLPPPLNSHTDWFICKENASVLFIQWQESLQCRVRFHSGPFIFYFLVLQDVCVSLQRGILKC